MLGLPSVLPFDGGGNVQLGRKGAQQEQQEANGRDRPHQPQPGVFSAPTPQPQVPHGLQNQRVNRRGYRRHVVRDKVDGQRQPR